MSVSETAQLAYPKDKKECTKHLRNCFIRCLPHFVADKKADAELAQKDASHGEKNLPFASKIQIVSDLQASQLERRHLYGQLKFLGKIRL